MKKIFLFSTLSLTLNSYAQVRATSEMVNNLNVVNLTSVSSLYKSADWSEDKTEITVVRSIDNNEFKLNILTGELIWKSQIIAHIPNTTQINAEKNIFPINVIETLTGTHASMDKDTVVFNYDVKLQSSNWNLFINNELVNGNIRSVGNVLLMPIDIIAKKLGSNVEFISDMIVYRRLQDGAKIELNTNTGLIRVNDKIQGTVGNLFFIDPIQKIVPLNIVEILAGVNVEVESNKNRVNLTLDSRIANTAFGSKLIVEELKNTPLTLQSIEYDINSDGYTTLKSDIYMSEYNGRINYQSGAGIFDKNGAHPSFLNFQWSSYSGSSGTIGDVNLGNRQLSGINISRVQGIEYNNTTSDGNYNYSLVAGQIIQNNNKIIEQQYNDLKNRNSSTYIPLEYGGGAYGIKIYPRNKPYEFGLSYLDDPQLGRKWAIASFTYKTNNTQNNDWNYYFNIDGGQIENRLTSTDKDSGFDWKSNWSANKNYDKFNLNFDGSYSGQLFEQYYQPTLQTLINNNNGIGNNPLSPLLPNIDNIGYSKFSQNANVAYKLTDNIALSYGFNYNQRKNEINSFNYSIHNFGISKTFKDGSLSLNNLIGNGSDLGGDYNINIINGIAQKKFEYVNLMGRIDYDRTNKFTSGQVNVQFLPYQTEWENIRGTLNTNVNYNFSKRNNIENNSSFLNLNYAINNKQSLKGWNITGGVGASVKLYEKNNNANYINNVGENNYSSNKSINPFFFANANYAVNKAFRFQVSASYDTYNKFKVFAGITGVLDFVPQRSVSNYIPQKGVLKGKVFIDENYDGIHQETEDKPISVLVSIKGTGLSLYTNETGNFTIQNLNPNLYELGVSLENLPLGWVVDEKANTSFSISADNITEIVIPIKKVYRIIGQVFSEKLEVEGLIVEVYQNEKNIMSTLTTFGGQFAVDGLKPDKYLIKIYDHNGKEYIKEINVFSRNNDKVIVEI